MSNENKNEFKIETKIKVFVAFLASGTFAAVHKEYLEPSSGVSSVFPFVEHLHHWVHSIIGVVLLIFLFLWLCWLCWKAYQVIFRKQKSNGRSEKKDSNGRQ